MPKKSPRPGKNREPRPRRGPGKPRESGILLVNPLILGFAACNLRLPLAVAEECHVQLPVLILKGGLKCRFHTPGGLHARHMTARAAEPFKECGFRTVRLSCDMAGLGGPVRGAEGPSLAKKQNNFYNIPAEKTLK